MQYSLHFKSLNGNQFENVWGANKMIFMKDSKVTALEIVQLPTDEFVVRKAGEKTALLTINISAEFKEKLEGLQIDLASKMLIAGIEYLSESSQIEAANIESKRHTLH